MTAQNALKMCSVHLYQTMHLHKGNLWANIKGHSQQNAKENTYALTQFLNVLATHIGRISNNQSDFRFVVTSISFVVHNSVY